MSRENVELAVRVMGQARARPETFWEVLDEDVVWDVGELTIPDSPEPRWHGPKGVREFFRRWTGPFDDWGFEVWQVWGIRDGKVVWASHHPEKEDALAAAGAPR